MGDIDHPPPGYGRDAKGSKVMQDKAYLSLRGLPCSLNTLRVAVGRLDQTSPSGFSGILNLTLGQIVVANKEIVYVFIFLLLPIFSSQREKNSEEQQCA